MCLLLENVGGCVHAGRPEVVTLNICHNWPVLFRATHILQENVGEHMPVAYWKDNFRVHVSLGSAETLVRRGGIINHHSIAYSLSNISAKNYRNWLMWVESIVCNISVVFSVVFLRHSVLHAITCCFFDTFIKTCARVWHTSFKIGLVTMTIKLTVNWSQAPLRNNPMPGWPSGVDIDFPSAANTVSVAWEERPPGSASRVITDTNQSPSAVTAAKMLQRYLVSVH